MPFSLRKSILEKKYDALTERLEGFSEENLEFLFDSSTHYLFFFSEIIPSHLVRMGWRVGKKNISGHLPRTMELITAQAQFRPSLL